jgi:hypothetical protein
MSTEQNIREFFEDDQNRQPNEHDISERNLYKYKNIKFKEITDFIRYLDQHYLELDDIAKDVLNDPKFLGWLKQKSGFFDESIEEFKSLRSIIDQKE